MDETFDFVVVGSGGGSMCAGLVMRQAGKSVLILEKTDLIGGSTAKAGGVMWIPANRFMKEAGVADSVEQGERYLDAVVAAREGDAPGTSRERRRTYITEANAMLEFLIRQGVPFERAPHWPDYYDDRDGGTLGRTVHAKLFDVNELGAWKAKLRPNAFQMPVPIYNAMILPLINRSWKAKWTAAKMVLKGLTAKLTGKHWVTAGAALQGRMLQAALKAGVELRTGIAVKEVVIEDGACTGVVVEKDGLRMRIGARLGVLLNAGGFAHNQDMRNKYIPGTRSEWSIAAEGDTGDMHREMMRIGAQMGQMEEMVGNQNMMPPGDGGPAGAQMQLCKPHAFLVDQSGQRYMNEGGSYMLFCQNMLERHRTVPALPSWMIMDSQFIRTYMLAATLPGANKPADWLSSGFLRKGDTIEDLAMACGIQPAALKDTTERFNRFARQGKDEDFGRGDRAYDRFLGDYTHGPNATLGTVEQGPFYAVAINPGDVGTFGGVVTDSAARVLREDGAVIRGLYATGTTTAAVMGRTYPGAGCSIGPSFTWGFVAAKHAAGLGNQSI
ncbi:FAD-binding protein [Novosphingobium sp. JCM 18896]|uniref:FAD-binding protein n=1 Tax=Novosphingobium sp. JCM 18896 TaxID=2989731 RepID=UPI0022234941|nr:FAD-binding protein [Novosphingobium sp. JCM 18896]MCW1431092.1 FAD-dependent oxidoreductase [Novosphingobium sp. JCM 18896]